MEVFPDITDTLFKLSSHPVDFNKTEKQLVEKFISILHDRSKSFKVDNTRKKLFIQKNSTYGNIPPTSSALKYHIQSQRAVFQASIILGQALENMPSHHSLEDLV